MKPLSLEALFTSRNAFGIETASPLQRAICRASDGIPLEELWREQTVRDAFGVRPPSGVVPSIMLVLAAIRSAKSTLAAAKVFACSQTVDLTGVKNGDEIRIPVLSTDKDAARATFTHIAGAIMGSKALRTRLIGEPTADTLWLRHPAGAAIEVKVTALARYGSTVVSRWLAGMVLDEAPRMSGEEDSVKNLNEALRATAGRILPGGQTWLVGSPWAPLGPIYDMTTEHEGRPSQDIVVIRAPGPAMNPVYWTPKRCAELQRKDPRAYQTDVLALFADPDEALFASALIEASRRANLDDLPPVPRVNYVACLDPATRNPNWSLIVLANYGNCVGPGGQEPLLRVAVSRQWRPDKLEPLNPDDTLKQIAKLLRAYGLTYAYAAPRTLSDIVRVAERHGLHLMASEETDTLALAEALSVPMAHRTLELSPDRGLRNDLVGVRKLVTPAGYRLLLPKTGDGRHADYVIPLATCYAHRPEAPATVERARDTLFDARIEWLNRDREDAVTEAAGRLM